MTALDLADYSLIGNSRAAALVSRMGAIEWCCLPEFHSPSVFASLLDRNKGGFFSIAPADGIPGKQRYLPDTNILETSFDLIEGSIRILDCFTIPSVEAKKRTLFPEHEILRVVEGVAGCVQMKLRYFPRPWYGKLNPHLKDRKQLGIHCGWKEDIYTFLTTLPPDQLILSEGKDNVSAQFEVKQGERILFSLSYCSNSPAVLPELALTGWQRLEETVLFWKNWIAQCTYSGFYEEHVRRSALVLKLLAHAPSGAIIAAPTTSVPEKPGGERNWDYRYCWLRDASFTVNALMDLGFEEEAHAYMSWILHATRLTRPEIQVVYSVYGHTSLKEQSLDWLEGYQDSRPVRIGNGADTQFQLDLYGEVMDAAYTYYQRTALPDRDTKKFITGLGEAICRLWNKPDNGIWEIRSAPVHHTHSKVMAWVGLDRIIKLSEKFAWKDLPLQKYQQVAAQLRMAIEAEGYNESLQSYTRAFKGNTLDASLLTLPMAGYCDFTSPRMISTVKAIENTLSENRLIYRYLGDDDGVAGDEGSFGVCNFWLIMNLARSGNLEKAIDLFETMLDYCSPTGLFSEEADPDLRTLLGNYPQGFTHIGLINAAVCINEVLKKTMKK